MLAKPGKLDFALVPESSLVFEALNPPKPDVDLLSTVSFDSDFDVALLSAFGAPKVKPPTVAAGLSEDVPSLLADAGTPNVNPPVFDVVLLLSVLLEELGAPNVKPPVDDTAALLSVLDLAGAPNVIPVFVLSAAAVLPPVLGVPKVKPPTLVVEPLVVVSFVVEDEGMPNW